LNKSFVEDIDDNLESNLNKYENLIEYDEVKNEDIDNINHHDFENEINRLIDEENNTILSTLKLEDSNNNTKTNKSSTLKNILRECNEEISKEDKLEYSDSKILNNYDKNIQYSALKKQIDDIQPTN